RLVCYLTGTRADFGLMRSTLERIASDRTLKLRLIVTGMHLAVRHGRTEREVARAGFDIAARVPYLPAQDSGAASARALGTALTRLTAALERAAPDVLLLLGDRGETLAGALAAAHLNIPIAHVHGGDVSGTLDEGFRHCVTKLAHLHLAATRDSARRIRRMGEPPELIRVVGAPGLDAIISAPPKPDPRLAARWGLDPGKPYLILAQHPVHQSHFESGAQMRETLRAVASSGLQALVIGPNSDAGNRAILRAARVARAGGASLSIQADVPRSDFLVLLAGAAAIVGNSSAGIIEAASLGIPAVNVGSRQDGRERNANVLDVPHSSRAIEAALEKAVRDSSFRRVVARRRNVYGDGSAGFRIAQALRRLRLTPALLGKRFRE
ncbi:MAG: UDP-N-acetylglucosamine 2-epimerase (hydrolyzing), partial [Elusimicrobia bacterium]|nr:UDP-N-acetylglucosamine 2-epimerase (hydrolyzing) [Elusimicrobiota bacterium]